MITGSESGMAQLKGRPSVPAPWPKLTAILLASAFACACGGTSHKQTAASAAGHGESVASAGTFAATNDADAVVCGSTVCTVPAMAFGFDVKATGLDIQACCANLGCGIRVVGNPAFRDVCVAAEPPAANATTGCPSFFDRELNVYMWGCCLSDGVCGQIWNATDRFGCTDPRVINGPPTEPCQAGNPCKVMDTPCASEAECCQIPPHGTSCIAAEGSSSVCTPNCQQDSDCGTQCCRPGPNGVKICVAGGACLQSM